MSKSTDTRAANTLYQAYSNLADAGASKQGATRSVLLIDGITLSGDEGSKVGHFPKEMIRKAVVNAKGDTKIEVSCFKQIQRYADRVETNSKLEESHPDYISGEKATNMRREFNGQLRRQCKDWGLDSNLVVKGSKSKGYHVELLEVAEPVVKSFAEELAALCEKYQTGDENTGRAPVAIAEIVIDLALQINILDPQIAADEEVAAAA